MKAHLALKVGEGREEAHILKERFHIGSMGKEVTKG